MDPLSISASAVALITLCVQTVRTIQKTIETVKAAKAELLSVLNETNRTRLLLEQLRALTHQLGSRNNKVLLDFDGTECRTILDELKQLVDKLAEAGKFVGLQFLVRRSKFEALVTKLRAQEDGIRTVLLSIATESAVFTREFVQTLIDGTNVRAVSITSVIDQTFDDTKLPYISSTESARPPTYTRRPNEMPDSILMEREVDDPSHISSGKEDVIPLVGHTVAPTSNEVHQATTTAGDNQISQLPIIAKPVPGNQELTKPITGIPNFVEILSKTAVWHGQLSRAYYDDEELEFRDQLADSAYCGAWRDVEEIVENAGNFVLKSWPNCYRLRASKPISGWTPLHQAAFLSAPRHVVEMLIDEGASRSLQTIRTSPSSQLPYKDMTALEIAQFLGSKHLFDILSPVIRHHIPATTISKLQHNFHGLIWGDMADRPEYARLRLPELELLTELENPEMFFPLRSQKKAMGYFYRLDGRELLVASLGVSSSEDHLYYRITEQGTRRIEDAVLFDMT